MSEDTCRPVVVDGEVIRVRGGAQMGPEEIDALAVIVRAAKHLMEVRDCPDCEQGKHHNCDGRAWDNDADDFAPCPCAHTGHGDATARCELTELLVDQCACRIHAPVSITPNDYVIVARFPARFDSRCDGCDNAMAESDPIARTQDGDYVCSECAS